MKDEYRMKLLHIDQLPDVATAKSIRDMIEQDKYRFREQGCSKKETKDIIQKKLLQCHIATGEQIYHHAYSLLHIFRQREI